MEPRVSPTLFHHNIHEFEERLKLIAPLDKEIHVDIMDGIFVHDTSLEPEHIPPLQAYNKLWSAHLMVEKPELYIDGLKQKGFKKVIIHIESLETPERIHEVITHIKAEGMQAWLAKNPDTALDRLLMHADEIDGALFMGIQPGKEGQPFDEHVYAHILRFANSCDKPIAVDGGVRDNNAKRLGKSGVTTLYVGSALAHADSPANAHKNILEALKNGVHAHKKDDSKHDRDIQLAANTIRQYIITQVHAAQSGHPAGALGMADIFAYLYAKELKHDPAHPTSNTRDYLFLSNGHICAVLYATLAENGYFDKQELETFRKLGSRLQGHPHVGALPGVENSGGPLGQGISQAVGAAALFKRMNKENRVYCVCGDGEINEGQSWEAALYAAKEKLHNYVQIIDRNNIQIDGNTNNVMPLEPLTEKYESFGFYVINIDAHNIEEIREAFSKARRQHKPVCIIAHTTPGKGVSYMERDYRWHGKAPNDKQRTQAITELEEEQKRLRIQ